MANPVDATAAESRAHYQLAGSPAAGLTMGTWGFFVGFAAVALYGPAAKYFQDQMHLGGLALGLLVAAPQLTGSLLRIPFGAWVDRVGGRLPMLTLFGLSLVGMWGLVFILLTVRTLNVGAYPIVIMFGFLSGCGVASFSVGIPQVSYWYPQSRQGTVLGAYGGIGNLAPGIFTLLLPYAIAAWGLAGSYFAWFTFLLIGTAIYAWLARDAYFFQLRQQGFNSDASRRIAREKGQELFPNATSLAGSHRRRRRPTHLGPRRSILCLLRWIPGADRLVSDLLDQPPPYGREVRCDAGRARFFSGRRDHSRLRWHALRTHRRRAHGGPRICGRPYWRAHPHLRHRLLSSARGGIADRPRYGGRQRSGVQDGAEICAPGGRRRGGYCRRNSVRSVASSFRRFSGPSSMRSEHRGTLAASSPTSCSR